MPATLRRALLAAALALPASLAAQQRSLADTYRADADRIIEAAMKDSAAWHRIARLSDTFGHRLSGSRALEDAIDWVMAEMLKDGLDNVRGEPVKVPHWVRGEESATMTLPRRQALPMLGLGGSVGTPKRGITAEVLVVGSFDELRARAAEAKGKLVLFDVPFTTYGQTVAYRGNGPIEAAKAGAVGVLLRSVASYSMRTPHTGSTRYDTTGVVPKIPAAAISVEDAMMIRRITGRGEKVVVHLAMQARTLPDAQSRNVIGELRGREKPDEVVVFGGHIDSWDVGTGAMDDAGGVVVAWEALRVLKALGLQPRRTIRVVGWTNEENGLRGGTGYRDAHRAEADKHVLVMESDGGVFRPRGFGFTGSDSALRIVREIATLLKAVGSDSISTPGGGADIGPMMQLGVPGMGLEVDGTRYFWFHHSEADTPDKLDPRDVARCVATMAVMAYVVADMPDRLPRQPGTAAR